MRAQKIERVVLRGYSKFDFPPHFPYVALHSRRFHSSNGFLHKGGSFPGGFKSNIWQRVSLPGGFSFGIGFLHPHPLGGGGAASAGGGLVANNTNPSRQALPDTLPSKGRDGKEINV